MSFPVQVVDARRSCHSRFTLVERPILKVKFLHDALARTLEKNTAVLALHLTTLTLFSYDAVSVLQVLDP